MSVCSWDTLRVAVLVAFVPLRVLRHVAAAIVVTPHRPGATMSATQDRRREDNARRNGLGRKMTGPFALDLPLKLLRKPAILPELSMRVGFLSALLRWPATAPPVALPR